MFNRLGIGFQLTQYSFRLIKQKKSLLVFPAINIILTLSLLAIVMIPVVKVEVITWHTNHVTRNDVMLCFTLLALFFFIAHFISLLLNGGLTFCAIKQIKREPYKIATGFAIIRSHFSPLFLWTLLTTTVGILIRACEYCIEEWPTIALVNKIFAGLAWLIASFLILPVIVMENREPMPAIKRSVQLIKNTWGMVTIAYIGIGGIVFFLMITSLLPLVIGILIGGKSIVIIGSIITTILWIGISILSSASRTVLTAALYLYATGEKTNMFCDDTLLQKAFQ